MADQHIIPLGPDESPFCPNRGYDGGPVHPAHAAEVAASDRLYAVTQQYAETAVDVETMQAMDKASMAVSDSPGMKLYEVTTSDPHRPGYYQAVYLKCITCGFVLPMTWRPSP